MFIIRNFSALLFAFLISHESLILAAEPMKSDLELKNQLKLGFYGTYSDHCGLDLEWEDQDQLNLVVTTIPNKLKTEFNCLKQGEVMIYECDQDLAKPICTLKVVPKGDDNSMAYKVTIQFLPDGNFLQIYQLDSNNKVFKILKFLQTSQDVIGSVN